jgi:hypothetical protein
MSALMARPNNVTGRPEEEVAETVNCDVLEFPVQATGDDGETTKLIVCEIPVWAVPSTWFVITSVGLAMTMPSMMTLAAGVWPEAEFPALCDRL